MAANHLHIAVGVSFDLLPTVAWHFVRELARQNEQRYR